MKVSSGNRGATISIEIINKCDTIIELSSLENVSLVSQRIQQIQDWEDILVEISVLMGGKNFIIGMAQEWMELLTWQRTTEYEKDKTQATMNMQPNVFTDLIKKVKTQAKTVSEVQVEQHHQNSVPCITSSIIMPTGVTYRVSKNMKPPMLPYFSGVLPTPKDEAAYEPWIFQVRSSHKSYTDEAVQNPVISNVRGSAGLVIRAMGYDADLDADAR